MEYAGEWDLPVNRALYKAFCALHGTALRAGHADPLRRRGRAGAPTCDAVAAPCPGWCRSPRATATASASRAWRRGRRGARASTPSRSAPTPRSARRSTHFDGSVLVLTPVAAVRGARDVLRPAWSTRRPRSRTSRGARGRDGRGAARGSCSSGSRRCVGTASPPASCGRPASHASTGVAASRGSPLHLPMAHGSHLAEVDRLMTDVVAAGHRRTPRLRLPPHRRRARHVCGQSYADFEIRPRIGTRLWLGDRDALQVRATVLDVHAVERGDVFGYRGRSAPKHGHLVVVSGGTAHGIGLEAPAGGATLQATARPGSPGAGSTRPASCARRSPSTASSGCSPSRRTCRPRCCSCPPAPRVPAVGDEVDVRVRFTATAFDRTVTTVV